MDKVTEHCDLCEIEFSLETGKNGFCATIGYSKNGWGNRRDFVRRMSGEFCDSCFSKLAKPSKKLRKVLGQKNPLKLKE